MNLFRFLPVLCSVAVEAFNTTGKIQHSRLFSPRKNRVAVIGAGVSGLVAAKTLNALGYQVTVYEREDRVGGQVYSEDVTGGSPVHFFSSDPAIPDILENECDGAEKTELGAVFAIEDLPLIADIADEVGVSYVKTDLDQVQLFVVIDGQRLTLVETLLFVSNGSKKKALKAMLAYAAALLKFPEIFSPNHISTHKDLSLPFLDFAEKYHFAPIAEMARALLVGFGYGYIEKVPAAYYMKFLAAIIRPTRDRLLADTLVFPCGFQSLWNAVAATLDIRLNAEVTEVRRTSRYIEIDANGQEKTSFDHLVLAVPLGSVSSFMDVTSEESDLLSRIGTIPYLTSVFGVDNLSARGQFYVYESGFEQRINHATIIANIDGSTASLLAYQILDGSTSVADATEILDEDLGTYASLNLTDVRAQKLWEDYFPTVPPQDFANGFHDRMEALQGTSNTYYLGGSLSFHSVDFVASFAEDVIKRKFKKKSLRWHR